MSFSVRVTPDEAENLPIILRTIVGSEVHGTGLPGLGDIDHMGIAAENRDNVLGTGTSPDSWSFRTAWARADVDGRDPRSTPGDLDLIIYPARRWAQLAIAGNPSVVAPLFVAGKHVVTVSESGVELRENRHRFVSQRLGRKHIGYAKAQRERMLGERSNGAAERRSVSAPPDKCSRPLGEAAVRTG